MKFVIITHVPHIVEKSKYFAYAPYVREMNIWTKFTDEVVIVAPIAIAEKTPIDTNYTHENIRFLPIASFDLLHLKSTILAFFKIPKIIITIYKSMQEADHIHLRCPGNIGLLGCFVQILFPSKIKTAKYAGNWDPQSKQPWSYKWQKWILNNTFLSRKIQVLVYGEWENTSKNIQPFFTATYTNQEKEPFKTLNFENKIKFIFVGTLVSGKNPLYAIQLIEKLQQNGYHVALDLYGDGNLKNDLLAYISENNLEKIIDIKGNQSQEIVKSAYQKSHFVVLPSESEGWPKAIAEGMFWGCVPIATKISCVPFILNYGENGILLSLNLQKDMIMLSSILDNESVFQLKRKKGADWSRNYTLNSFEIAVKKLMQV